MVYLLRQTTPRMKASRPTALMKRARRLIAVMLAATLVSIGLLNNAQASNCVLDPTFGSGGKVFTDFGKHEIATAAAIQTDGKIVAVGWTAPGGDTDFALARYNSDGSLDNTFGSGGRVVTDFFGSFDLAMAVAIQPDHKIVVAGWVNTGGGSATDFGVARYNSDGSLDDGTAGDSTPGDSFGDGGIVTTEFFGRDDYLNDLALQSDGKIIAIGSTSVSNSGNSDFCLVRYNPDGTHDTTFGSGGKATLDYSGSADGAASVAIQPTDGKIIVGGSASTAGPFRTDFALARYQTNGSLDPTFGNGGIVTTGYSDNDDHIVDIALQTDGRIVAAGITQEEGGAQFALARYNPDGDLDNSFDDDGKVVTDLPNILIGDLATSMALQPGSGKIVVAGFIGRVLDPTEINEAFVVVRYNTDGSLDTSFDSDGIIITDLFPSEDEANDVLIQPDGNIVAVGSSYHGTYDFALVRYLGDESDYPPRLNSLTLSVNKVLGGDRLDGKVTLCGPAPRGGLKVILTDTLDAATVHHTVKVRSGETTASFTIKTKSVTETQVGKIIARVGRTTRTAQLVIKPVGLFSLALEPDSVEGPKKAKGVVALTDRAPEGGVTVVLSSNNAAVASPTESSIFIPAGAQQSHFTVETRNVRSPSSATIIATANGTKKSKVLIVN